MFYRRTSFWITAAVIAAMAFFVYRKSVVSVEVKTASVMRQALAISVTATSMGTIKSDVEIKVTAQRSGKLSGLFVEEGDMVSEGQRVAEIDPAEARINLELATASLERARAVLAQLNAAYKALKVEVESGIERARARLEEVEERHDNLRELHERGFISRMELSSVQSEYQVAKADLEAALSRRETIEAKEREIKAQEAAVRETRSNLELAQLNYHYSFINAPVGGVISSRPVSRGETVAKGTLVAVIITTDSLYVEAFIDEADVERVRVGQQVEITMDAYPGEVLTGEVLKISPVVLGGRLETRTFEVRTRLPEGGPVVKPGMSADIEIIVRSMDDVLVIPSQAVMDREGRKYVFVKEGRRAALREIKTGISDWTNTQVLSGLEEGTEIIITPDVKGLEDGSRLTVEK